MGDGVRSAEHSLLRPTEEILDQAASEVCPDGDRTDARLGVLEAVASINGVWSLAAFRQAVGSQQHRDAVDPTPWAEKLLHSIRDTEIPVPLALAALSREVLTAAQQRTTGAYYT